MKNAFQVLSERGFVKQVTHEEMCIRDSYEPCQVLTEAAVSRKLCVPQSRLF